MLGRLWRRWRLRRSGQVFCYFDGIRKRYGDPLQLWRAFVHHPANLPALAPAVDEQKEPETTQFIQGVCEVFGLTRYDPLSGQGLTDAEVLMTVESFHADIFCHGRRDCGELTAAVQAATIRSWAALAERCRAPAV